MAAIEINAHCGVTGQRRHHHRRAVLREHIKAPKINPSRALIKGVVCGVRVEDIEEPTMREIRYLDKLIDELAQGKTMDKILRKK